MTLIKKWDICAPAAILAASSGQLTTLDGKPIDYSKAELAKVSSMMRANLIIIHVSE